MILIVSDQERIVRRTRKFLFDLHFNSYGSSIEQAEHMVESHKIHAAVILGVSKTQPISGICRKLRLKYPKLVIAVTYEEGYKEQIFSSLWYDCDVIMSDDSNVVDLLRAIFKSIEAKWGIDYYQPRKYGLYFPVSADYVCMDPDICLKMPTTGLLILKALALSYPNSMTPEEISEAAFDPASIANVENVPPMISVINQATVKMIDYKLISNIRGEGYVLLYKPKKYKGESIIRKMRRLTSGNSSEPADRF